jgi:hypothetical protein
MLSVTKSLLSQRRILVRMSRRGKALHQRLIDRCHHWMLWLQWLLDDSKVVGSTTPSNSKPLRAWQCMARINAETGFPTKCIDRSETDAADSVDLIES